ncbi:hypothetical protein H4582DRAFT_2061560 [Lactarius indigo]|nr:hypothetical protein H4582DRAFT_2061560 [Lactarius indigo]
MVNFHDPGVILQDSRPWAKTLNSFFALAVSVVKLWHTIDGLFIWEFFITLEYELSVLRRRRPYQWPIWVYSLTRVCTLVAVILNMLGFDASSPINCHLWIIFELIFAYLAFAAATLLIVLRIYAIWDGNKIAVSIAMSAWLTNVAFLIHAITQLRAAWVPVPGVCAVLNIGKSKNTVIVTLITDVILCLVMLVGLLRLRQHGITMVGLWNFLWKQGLIWVFLASVVQVVPTVFISLNLNGFLGGLMLHMFQTPSLIVMSIAATRMYRSLTDFTSTSGLLFDTTQTRSGRTTTSEPKRISTAPIPLDRIGMEVAVHRSYEDDYPAAHAGRYSSYVSTDSHSQDKPPALDADNDLENGVKSTSSHALQEPLQKQTEGAGISEIRDVTGLLVQAIETNGVNAA